MGIPLLNFSAMVSSYITAFYPLPIKIDKVIDKRTFEISYNREADKEIFSVQQTWDGCVYNIGLTPEEKERVYLRYHRSHNCFLFVQMFALALKQFCDGGMSLTHDGNPVVDIWVLNTDDFDVSDVQDSLLTIKDTETGFTLSGTSTYKNIDMLRQLSPNILQRFSHGLLEPAKKCESMKRHDINKYLNSSPHWWIAAIVEEVKSGVKMRRMIHIDICGAAFDESAFYRYDRNLVSLHIFETPEYDLFPVRDLPNVFKKGRCEESFVLRPYYRVSDTDTNYRYAFLRPWSFRHFRPYHWKNSSHLKATPLESFLSRSPSTRHLVTFSSLIGLSIRGTKLRLPAGMKVYISSEGVFTSSRTGRELAEANLQFLRGCDLKDRTGCIHDCITTEVARRYIPVSLKGFTDPIWVDPRDLRLTTNQWYSPFSELVKPSEIFRGPNPQRASAVERNAFCDSKAYQAAVESLMIRNPCLCAAFSTLVLGKIIYQFIQDQRFMNWVRRLLLPPFSKVLSAEDVWKLKRYIEVSEFQRMKYACELLNEMAAAKSIVMKHQMAEEETAGGGSSNETDAEDILEAMQTVTRLTNLVKDDDELTKFYRTMDELGLWHSPFQ